MSEFEWRVLGFSEEVGDAQVMPEGPSDLSRARVLAIAMIPFEDSSPLPLLPQALLSFFGGDSLLFLHETEMWVSLGDTTVRAARVLTRPFVTDAFPAIVFCAIRRGTFWERLVREPVSTGTARCIGCALLGGVRGHTLGA